MLNFWRAIFYSDLLAPVFNAVAAALGVTPQVCKEYCTSGIMMYGLQFTVLVVAVIAAIVLIWLFGLLNPGNLPKYNPDRMDKVKNSPLKGKRFIFLGSSVTKGFASFGKSFVDMVAARNDAVCVKEAASGTTLVDNGPKSYISRLKTIDAKTPCDVFVCQLSTNDATKKLPLGKLSAGTGLADFDTKTVYGAIEYIIAYAKETWNCPVVFYTNPFYADEKYAAMVAALKEIAGKWEISVVDFWNDGEISELCKKGAYRNDQIHPTKKGYQAMTPAVEAALACALSGKAVPAPKKSSALSGEALKKKVNGRRVKKIVLRVLAVILAILIVVGASTVQQLVTVTGMKNEGNSDKYAPEAQAADADSPIKGKTLLWLGSSVFQGFGAGKTSPAEWIDAINGTNSIVEVKGGTLLAGVEASIGSGLGSVSSSDSYLPRLMNHTTDTDPVVDLVVVQLSTNDSKGQCETGEVSESFDMDDFTLTTTVGALEAITAYSKETWGAPVLVITGTQFEDEMTYSGGQNKDIYQLMIERCHELDEKWGDDFSVLDLWHNDVMYENVVTGDTLWRSYMSDAIHPTKKGYLEWWGPYVEERLFELLG